MNSEQNPSIEPDDPANPFMICTPYNDDTMTIEYAIVNIDYSNEILCQSTDTEEYCIATHEICCDDGCTDFYDSVPFSGSVDDLTDRVIDLVSIYRPTRIRFVGDALQDVDPLMIADALGVSPDHVRVDPERLYRPYRGQ